MGSNFSIFGSPLPSSSLKASSHNRDSIGNLKHRFETKNSKCSREGVGSSFPRDCNGGHQGIVKLKNNKEFIGECFKLQDETSCQFELVAASPSMANASKSYRTFSDKIVKQQGSIEHEENPENELIYLKSPTEIHSKTQQGSTASFPESTSTNLHQLKRMRPSKASRGSFFGDAIEHSTEVSIIETNRDTQSNEEGIGFSPLLVPRDAERQNLEYSVGLGNYSQQILTSHHLFHDYNGLASLQNTASSYDENLNNQAVSILQSKISYPKRECVNLEILRMNQYMPPDGLPNLSHKSSCQFFTAVAPYAREIHYEGAHSEASLPTMAADFPLKESELILASGKNSSKRSSAKQLVDGVLNAVSRSSPKWKGEEKQVKTAPESAKESLHPPGNREKVEHGRKGAPIKRNLKARAAHQARLASSPSGKDILNDISNKTWIPSSIDSEKQLLDSVISGNTVKVIHGYKVTIVDEENKVFIIDLVSPETCKLIRRLADDHCSQAEACGNLAASWRTLYTYSKMDLPCCEVKDLTNLSNNIMAKVILIVGEIFGDRDGVAKLRPRSWKEPHLLKYQAIDGFPHHTGICEHYDGCDITWQVMLTDMNEYTGGGTYFRCNRKTIKLRLGQVLVHPGELYHKGVDITSGIRELLICFLDGFDPQIIDKSDPKNDRVEYEKNVIVC